MCTQKSKMLTCKHGTCLSHFTEPRIKSSSLKCIFCIIIIRQLKLRYFQYFIYGLMKLVKAQNAISFYVIFKKVWYALPVSSTFYNQKTNFLLDGSKTTTIYSPSHISNSLETFLTRNCFYSNAKKYKQDKKYGIHFDLTTDFLIEKY